MKKNKAITLIALIITIIVLLILAGVSISMLTGDNGILNKAKTVKEDSNAGDIEEQNKLGKYNDMMDSYTTSRGTTDLNFTWDIGANYYAKKYDNGVMELYGKYAGTMTTTNAWASCYFQSITEIVFPVSFNDVPCVVPVLSREGSGNVFNLSMDSTTKTGFKFYPLSMNGMVTNVPYSVSYTAIGHWK